MKILNLIPALLFILLFGRNTANAQSNLLSKIDTNMVLTYNGEPIKYHQYMALLKTGDFQVVSSFNMEHNTLNKELRKFTPDQKKNLKLKMDQASIDKRIAQSFGIQEKLPLSEVDTTIIVFNTDGKPLKYYQYAPLVLNKQFTIMHEKGKRYLKARNTGMMKIAGVDTAMLNAMNSAFYGDGEVLTNNLLYWALQKADHIRVEKSKRKIYVERNGKILYEFPINLGKHPIGHKQKEGDGRTPEGLYYIDYNINSKAAYTTGFHISYPNAKDSLNAKKMAVKPGGDVMIHGTSADRSKLKDWTNGCIAISNENLGIIAQYYYNSIPILINK